jgi:hypothetical protein
MGQVWGKLRAKNAADILFFTVSIEGRKLREVVMAILINPLISSHQWTAIEWTTSIPQAGEGASIIVHTCIAAVEPLFKLS